MINIAIKENNMLEITGNIKSLDDYNILKNACQSLVTSGAREITLNIKESLSMVSSVIGYLVKLINLEGIKVRVLAHDERLYDLLDQLRLIQLFNVQKVK